MYSRARAPFGSLRNLIKASGLPKNKVEQFLQTKTPCTKFGSPVRCFRRHQVILKLYQWSLVFGLGFCGQTSESKQWSQMFIGCC